MKKQLIITFLLMLGTAFTKLYAGWYECYNFKGTIGQYPITLSMQVFREGYGDKKAGINIQGVYKYDKHNEPINLEGKIDFKTGKTQLYEGAGKKHTAVFEFTFSEGECTGTWKNMATLKQLPLHLNYISKLADTAETDQYSNVEILQSKTFGNFYFVGVYSKPVGNNRARMEQLKVLNKKDNSLLQVIDLTKIGTDSGNIYTVIYGNVDFVDVVHNEFNIWNDIGRMGGLLTVTFDPKKGRFVLDPKPRLDGVGG